MQQKYFWCSETHDLSYNAMFITETEEEGYKLLKKYWYRHRKNTWNYRDDSDEYWTFKGAFEYFNFRVYKFKLGENIGEG